MLRVGRITLALYGVPLAKWLVNFAPNFQFMSSNPAHTCVCEMFHSTSWKSHQEASTILVIKWTPEPGNPSPRAVQYYYP